MPFDSAAVAGPLAVPTAATAHALAHAAERGEFAPCSLADLAAAAATLGHAACGAGLAFDDLLGLVGDLVDAARSHTAHGGTPDADDAPQADALLLYLWRLTGRAYQAAVVARAAPPLSTARRAAAV